MIGDTPLGKPLTVKECRVIFKLFNLAVAPNADYIFENATQLVMMNNEVYEFKQSLK